MSKLSVNGKHTGFVVDFSNSGNPVVDHERASKQIVVKARNQNKIDKGDKLEYSIQEDNRSHYLANLLTHTTANSTHDPDSTPNIPIHHDGNSATASRSESKATKSVDDRKFDPKTHGAPQTSKKKRERQFLRNNE